MSCRDIIKDINKPVSKPQNNPNDFCGGCFCNYTQFWVNVNKKLRKDRLGKRADLVET